MFHSKKVFVLKKISFLVIFSFLFLVTLHVYSAVVVKGDSSSADQTFNFCIGDYSLDLFGDYFYISSKDSGAQEYTVSRFRYFEDEFKPLCPEFATVHGQDNKPNPVYNKAIKFMSLIDIKKDGISSVNSLNTYPVLVTVDEPNIIYVLDLTRYYGKLYEENKTESFDFDKPDVADNKQLKSKEVIDSKNKDNKACPSCQTMPIQNNGGGDCTQKISKISVLPFNNIRDAVNGPITTINGIEANSTGSIFAGVDIGSTNGGIAVMKLLQATVNEDKLAQELNADKELNSLENGLKKKDAGDFKDSNLNNNIGEQEAKKNNTNQENNTSNKNSNKKVGFGRQKQSGKNNTQNNLQNQNMGKNQNKNAVNKNEIKKDQKEPKKVWAVFGLPTQPLNVTSSFVKIGSNLASIEYSDMYFDSRLNSLFIALNVQAGSGASDGCKALVIGKIDKTGLLTLQDFATNSVFSGTNQIVGAVGANAQVSLHKVRVMHSSTRLAYTIVLGANGDPASTKKSVYALPVVIDPDKAENAMLASNASLPQDLFAKESIIKYMVFRFLRGTAQNSSQVYTINDDAAKVGFGPLDYDISEIYVVSDAVLALVKSPENNGNGAFYMSRALFDNYGKVKRWTAWQLVSTSTEPLFGASLNPTYGDFIWLTGSDASNVKTVEKTVWSLGATDGIKSLSEVIAEQFPKNISGVQGLFEFPYSPLGEPTGMNDITLLVTTGYKKVVLSELAYLSGGQLIRNTGDFASGFLAFPAGQITTNFPVAGSKVISISGGVLDKIGPVQAATVTSVNNNGRLFVGGIGGLAALVDGSGNGWVTGLGPNFAGLTNGMSFVMQGNFGFVRKILQDGNYLYVLTDTAFYRIDLTSGANNFAQGVLDVVQIASLDSVAGADKYSSFYDFAVSWQLGFLATSYGLFRVGDGVNIQTATSSSINWTRVLMPSNLGPIKQLLPISSTLREQDVFTQNNNGDLFVLSSYYGNDSSQFNRFAISYDIQVTSSAALPFPDFYIANNKTGTGSYSYLMNFGMYRDILSDQGAIRYTAECRNLSHFPYTNILLPGLFSGLILPETQSKLLPLDIVDDSQIVRVLRSSTGPLIIAGDFGFRVNE